MSEWRRVLLTDISIKMGDGLHGTPEYDENGEYFFINGNNLLNGKVFIKPDTKKINETEYNKIKKELNNTTILLSINGTIGNVSKYMEEKCALGKSVCYINLDTNIIIRNYFYYECLSNNFQYYIDNIATGTTIPNVPLKGIRTYEFNIPSIPEQKAIASVLSSLDDKIDLLRRQNKTLESMAETLFRQWFDGNTDEWQEKNVLEIFKLVGGGTPKTSVPEYWKDEIPWVSGGDISVAHQGFIISTEKRISLLGLENSSAKLLPKYSTVISARGTVGKYALLIKNMAFSQSNYGIVSKIGNYPFFIYLLIGFIIEDLLAAAYGSVFDTITTRTFESVNLKLPTLCEIENFEKRIASIFTKKERNQLQIQTLEKLRDTLLPKLMSGEVRVQYTKE